MTRQEMIDLLQNQRMRLMEEQVWTDLEKVISALQSSVVLTKEQGEDVSDFIGSRKRYVMLSTLNEIDSQLSAMKGEKHD